MHAYQTETRESGTLSFRVEWFYDSYSDAPWDEECGHGEVSDWTTRDKRPGEMILSSDRRMKRFYDFAGAVKTARAEGWNTAPFEWPSAGAKAHAAAMADFDYLRRWCNDDWHYCGIVVTLLNADGEPDSVDASLWRIESDSPECHEEVVNELIQECLDQIATTIGVNHDDPDNP